MSFDGVAVMAISIARDDAVGGVLVLLAILFGLLGFALSREGLRATIAATHASHSVRAAQSSVAQAQQAVTRVQSSTAQLTGPDVGRIADSAESVASSTSVIQDQVAAVNEALAGLTGNQAPARVAWSLGALCLVAALVSFDLISVSVALNSSAGR